MSTVDLKIQGGCLCGSVRYAADIPPLKTVVCHCRNCQKQSGTSFSVVLAIARDALWIRGDLVDFVDRGDSGRAVVRRFCGRCGSPILSVVPERPDVVFVKAGTLDDSSGLVPEAHIWCRSAQPWIEIDPRLPKFDRSP